MYRAQILLESEQHKALMQIAQLEKRSLSDIVREIVGKEINARKQKALANAAQVLLADYQTDTELIAFQALAGDDFHG